MSFYSKPMYRDVALSWRGSGLGYLFALLTFCWIPMMIVFQAAFLDFSSNEMPAIARQLPKIAIVDGNVSATGDQPCYIRLPDSKDVLAIIDTTGQIQSLDTAQAAVLLTKNKLMFKATKFETRTFDLSQVRNLVLDEDVIMSWIDTARMYLVLLLYPVCLLASFVYRTVQVLFYAAIGAIFASSCKKNLSFPVIFRLSTVAITPPIVISLVLAGAGCSLPPDMTPVYFVMAMAYLLFGIQAATTQEVTEQPQVGA
jgi:hypothetical protein